MFWQLHIYFYLQIPHPNENFVKCFQTENDSKMKWYAQFSLILSKNTTYSAYFLNCATDFHKIRLVYRIHIVMACLECATCLESTTSLQWHKIENMKKDNRTPAWSWNRNMKCIPNCYNINPIIRTGISKNTNNKILFSCIYIFKDA